MAIPKGKYTFTLPSAAGPKRPVAFLKLTPGALEALKDAKPDDTMSIDLRPDRNTLTVGSEKFEIKDTKTLNESDNLKEKPKFAHVFAFDKTAKSLACEGVVVNQLSVKPKLTDKQKQRMREERQQTIREMTEAEKRKKKEQSTKILDPHEIPAHEPKTRGVTRGRGKSATARTPKASPKPATPLRTGASRASRSSPDPTLRRNLLHFLAPQPQPLKDILETLKGWSRDEIEQTLKEWQLKGESYKSLDPTWDQWNAKQAAEARKQAKVAFSTVLRLPPDAPEWAICNMESGDSAPARQVKRKRDPSPPARSLTPEPASKTKKPRTASKATPKTASKKKATTTQRTRKESSPPRPIPNHSIDPELPQKSVKPTVDNTVPAGANAVSRAASSTPGKRDKRGTPEKASPLSSKEAQIRETPAQAAVVEETTLEVPDESISASSDSRITDDMDVDLSDRSYTSLREEFDKEYEHVSNLFNEINERMDILRKINDAARAGREVDALEFAKFGGESIISDVPGFIKQLESCASTYHAARERVMKAKETIWNLYRWDMSRP
ncbi:hypothetical protein HK104_001413 [Borealophlyctis nickersoniae]|nr:hypothetical protein HK104_001413 [Borealophlyctis nickersoniae]